ncbi:hypothetical protein OBV_07950 [Oscillibacter valericigenes Sjm18-20]|nr:hypothetical protein OBV_07950 [Oscillibacter valericigenes Sjm18-20]
MILCLISFFQTAITEGTEIIVLSAQPLKGLPLYATDVAAEVYYRGQNKTSIGAVMVWWK